MMIWFTKKLKEQREYKKRCETRRVLNSQMLAEMADSLAELNNNITENTELLQPMVENLSKYLQVQLAASEQSLKDYNDFKPTEDDLRF